VINYSKLPNWLEMAVWGEALLRSGMMGTYSFDFDINKYTIRNPHILQDEMGKDVNRAFSLPTDFYFTFRESMELSSGGTGGGRSRMWVEDALRTAFKKIDPRNNWHLYHYDAEAVEWHRDNGHVSLYEVRETDDPNVRRVIYNVVPYKWYVGAPAWNPNADTTLEMLFG